MELYTLEKWAQYVIERWESKVVSLNIGDTYQLLHSFASTVYLESGGDTARVNFLFNYYGKFVDMGVGNGITLENRWNKEHARKRKLWYTPVFFGQVKRLAEILARNCARRTIMSINTFEVN